MTGQCRKTSADRLGFAGKWWKSTPLLVRRVCVCVCVCLYVHKSPWQEVSRKWRDFHSSVYFHISAKNIWLHSKQIDGIREKVEFHRALKNEQGNVNIMYQTNIFVCGSSFQGLIDMCKDHSCVRMWVLKSPASGSTSQTFLNRSSSLLLEWAGLSWTNGTDKVIAEHRDFKAIKPQT